MQVYIDFSSEVAAWMCIAEGDVSLMLLILKEM